MLHFLAGEVNGLRAVLFALFNTHSNPGLLLAELERLGEVATAISNPMPVTDAYLAGQEQAVKEFTAHARALSGK
jgi:hypothetical protein